MSASVSSTAENRPQGIVALLGAGASRPAELAAQARLLAARVGAEMERERLATDSRQTEKRWLELIRGTPDGLFDITLGSGPVFLSRRCLELLGYPRPCAARLDAAAPLGVGASGGPRAARGADRPGARGGHHLKAAVRLRRRGGDHRWFDVHARLTRETTPGPVRALGFISEADPCQAGTGDAEADQRGRPRGGLDIRHPGRRPGHSYGHCRRHGGAG